MYYTGCDVHDKITQLQHMDADGTLGLFMEIATSKEGFSQFLDKLDAPTIITLEASGQYWWLSQFLESHPKVKQVNVVDPRRCRKLSEELSVVCGYGRAKNDRIDAEMQAELSRRGLAPTIHVPTPEQLRDRTLNRHRFSLVGQRTRIIRQIQGLLKMLGISISISKLINDPRSQKQVLEALPDYALLIVLNLLTQISVVEKRIEKTETMLDEVLPLSNPQIKILISHPGIATVLSRTIKTEILDIKYFAAYKYLVSYSGLAPIIQESAGKKSTIKLNRFCNYYLKYAFIAAAHGARYHPRYKRKYEQDEKKHGPIIAKLNLARRIAKTIYWMLTRQQPFTE